MAQLDHFIFLHVVQGVIFLAMILVLSKPVFVQFGIPYKMNWFYWCEGLRFVRVDSQYSLRHEEFFG